MTTTLAERPGCAMPGSTIEGAPPPWRAIASSRRLAVVLIVVGVLLVLVSAVRFQAPELLGQHKVLTDFDSFHIAGQLAAAGKAVDAYHFDTLLDAQRQISGTRSFMPWTYPPPFTLAMQALAYLPVGLAFALFALGSFAFYLWVLHRIAGKWLPASLIAVMPTILLNLRTGQNGFLIGSLIGLVLLLAETRRALAGVPLGLMVIKPHLAVGVAVTCLVRLRWMTIAVAACVAALLSGLASLAYGWGIWADFLGAVREAAGFLAEGYYLLFRMSSIYAVAFTFGASARLAMGLQALGAALALLCLARACLRGMAYRHLAALTCAASLFVSPYGYDYDLTVLGVGLAFVMPDLLDRCAARELALLLALSWFACGFGMGWSVFTAAADETGGMDASNAGIALIAPALALLCWRIVVILRRPPRDAPT